MTNTMKIIVALAETLAAEPTTDNNKMTIIKSRADEFVELVRNDKFKYTHREEYLAMLRSLDSFDQKVVLMKIEKMSWPLWSYLKDRI